MFEIQMKLRSGKSTHYIFALIVSFCLLPNVHGQELSNFCRQAESTPANSVMFEVKLSGRGMTSWPLIPQVFFRLYDDGRIQYEARNERLMASKKGRLEIKTIENLRRLINRADLVEAQPMYPMLESYKDALMRICVAYTANGRTHRILLINYMPDHPKANGYYPESLVELLRIVQDVRPATSYERKYGLNKLSS